LTTCRSLETPRRLRHSCCGLPACLIRPECALHLQCMASFPTYVQPGWRVASLEHALVACLLLLPLLLALAGWRRPQPWLKACKPCIAGCLLLAGIVGAAWRTCAAPPHQGAVRGAAHPDGWGRGRGRGWLPAVLLPSPLACWGWVWHATGRRLPSLTQHWSSRGDRVGAPAGRCLEEVACQRRWRRPWCTSAWPVAGAQQQRGPGSRHG
jgi:hypothetical protein